MFKMDKRAVFPFIALLALYTMCANSYILIKAAWPFAIAAASGALLVNAFAGFSRDIPTVRLKFCCHGIRCLQIFLVSAVLSFGWHFFLAFRLFPAYKWTWIISAVICVAAELLLFWNGIISIYCTSVQLGVKWRLLGAFLGFIPIVNLFVLSKLMRTVIEEVEFESAKWLLNKQRADKRLCATKYPILLVHGVCFRDYRLFSYWGRIAPELRRNGATVYFGEHQSVSSVENSAQELSARIRRITAETGCEKVNIIAHSKGGLDIRYAIAHCGIGDKVASLTTVNTPHHGCTYADYLFTAVKEPTQQKIAKTYNAAARLMGDHAPDFLAAMRDLTAARARELNAAMPLPEGIYCRSVGTVLKKLSRDTFPMNMSNLFVGWFEGPNDGLVSEPSFHWCEDYRLIDIGGDRGISHIDIADIYRKNVPGFDVREFYVQLVSELKERGV